MANSKYEYVKQFERLDTLLPSTYIVVRVDGRGFHRLSQVYEFRKPNDERALHLMNDSARAVLEEIPDICIAYGVSDEYSFAFSLNSTLFERRESKLLSTVLSTFTAFYLSKWPTHFPGLPLNSPLPTFDARVILYPGAEILKDYFRWRQVDCELLRSEKGAVLIQVPGHINNLYNTTFWTLVQKGALSPKAAEERLSGTLAADKNEILFSEFGVNYNNEEAMFKKGSVIYRKIDAPEPAADNGDSQPHADSGGSSKKGRKKKAQRPESHIVVEHLDIIKEDFWSQRPWLLS